MVPLNPGYTASELAPMLADADPAAVLYDSALAPTVTPLLDAMPLRDAPVRIEVGPAARRLTAWRGDARLAAQLPLPDPDGLSTLQYTGGTTGRAKGVDLNHRAVAVNVAQREALLPTMPGR